MEIFPKNAFLQLVRRLKEAGPDSDEVRRFVTDENFALQQLEAAVAEREKLDETKNPSKDSRPVINDFEGLPYFW